MTGQQKLIYVTMRTGFPRAGFFQKCDMLILKNNCSFRSLRKIYCTGMYGIVKKGVSNLAFPMVSVSWFYLATIQYKGGLKKEDPGVIFVRFYDAEF